MVSKKLTTIFLLALLLIVAHVVEELITGFPHIDSFMVFGGDIFDITPATFYWVFHIIWLTSVPLLFLMLRNKRVILPLLALFSLVFIVEIHHLVKALLIQSYYPGMITAFFYPVLGFFYWKQLFLDWHK